MWTVDKTVGKMAGHLVVSKVDWWVERRDTDWVDLWAVLSADVKAVSRVEQLVDSSVGQSAVHWVFL